MPSPLFHLMSMAYFGKSHSQGKRRKVNLGHHDDVRLKKAMKKGTILIGNPQKFDFFKKNVVVVKIATSNFRALQKILLQKASVLITVKNVILVFCLFPWVQTAF